jgi:hypothetical protein
MRMRKRKPKIATNRAYENYIAPYIPPPVETKCTYCKCKFHDDGQGACVACGAPKYG